MGNINNYKSVYQPTAILPVGIGNTLATFKANNKLSFQLSIQVHSPVGQTEEEKRTFFGGCKKVAALWPLITPEST